MVLETQLELASILYMIRCLNPEFGGLETGQFFAAAGIANEAVRLNFEKM
jgi:hypothetical protein